MFIIFIGSNPSTASKDNSAFSETTKSGRLLKGWIDELKVDAYKIINIMDTKKDDNKPLSQVEIIASLPYLKEKLGEVTQDVRIVALGAAASKALTLLNLKHFKAPHPSGLNRKLNDETYRKTMIEDLKKFIE